MADMKQNILKIATESQLKLDNNQKIKTYSITDLNLTKLFEEKSEEKIYISKKINLSKKDFLIDEEYIAKPEIIFAKK